MAILKVGLKRQEASGSELRRGNKLSLRRYIKEVTEKGIPTAQVLLTECYGQRIMFPGNETQIMYLKVMTAKIANLNNLFLF